MRFSRSAIMVGALSALALGAGCAPRGPGAMTPPWLDFGPGAWWLLAAAAAGIIWFAVHRAKEKSAQSGPDASEALHVEQRLGRLDQRLARLESRVRRIEERLEAGEGDAPDPAPEKEKHHEEV